MNSLLNCPAEAFFMKKENFDVLHGVVSREYKLTLKLLEYAAFNAGYLLQDVHLHGMYDNFLSAYGKREFDSFRRHRSREITRFGKTVITNIAQMRFIRFAKLSGLIDYLLKDENKLKVTKLMEAGITHHCIGLFKREHYFFPSTEITKIS